MYLGKKVSPDRLDFTNFILIDKPFSWKEDFKEIHLKFSLVEFKDYRFNEKNKLILKNPQYIIHFNASEKKYLEDLLNKIPRE